MIGQNMREFTSNAPITAIGTLESYVSYGKNERSQNHGMGLNSPCCNGAGLQQLTFRSPAGM